jgi:hypothetical protein
MYAEALGNVWYGPAAHGGLPLESVALLACPSPSCLLQLVLLSAGRPDKECSWCLTRFVCRVFQTHTLVDIGQKFHTCLHSLYMCDCYLPLKKMIYCYWILVGHLVVIPCPDQPLPWNTVAVLPSCTGTILEQTVLPRQSRGNL